VQVNYLGAIGGKDVAETTRRILRSLMTNGEFCWTWQQDWNF